MRQLPGDDLERDCSADGLNRSMALTQTFRRGKRSNLLPGSGPGQRRRYATLRLSQYEQQKHEVGLVHMPSVYWGCKNVGDLPPLIPILRSLDMEIAHFVAECECIKALRDPRISMTSYCHFAQSLYNF